MSNADDEKPGNFPRYLAAAMIAAGFERRRGEPDVPGLARAAGISDPMIRRWLAGSHEPTLDSLRTIAAPLHLEPRQLWVAAGLATASEVGLKEAPEPPRPSPPSVKEAIAANQRLTRRGKETLLYLIEQFEQGYEAERAEGEDQHLGGGSRDQRGA